MKVMMEEKRTLRDDLIERYGNNTSHVLNSMRDELIQIRRRGSPSFPIFGICGNLANVDGYTLIPILLQKWKHYSGEPGYPIAIKGREDDPMSLFSARKDFWNPNVEYGRRRWQAVDWLIDVSTAIIISLSTQESDAEDFLRSCMVLKENAFRPFSGFECGICGELDFHFSQKHRKFMMTGWRYNIDLSNKSKHGFVVPSSKSFFLRNKHNPSKLLKNGEDIYMYGWDDKWDQKTEYGRMRMNLLNWVIKVTKIQLDFENGRI